MLHIRSFVPSIRAHARTLLAGALLVCALVGTPAAHAQFGGRSTLTDAFQPDILQRDMDLLISVLELEEAQRPVIEMMLQDYADAFARGTDQCKDRMKQAADSMRLNSSGQPDGDRMLSAVMRELDAWRGDKQQLFTKLTSDVKSLLTQLQLERWPAFERALRRERMLHTGMLSGESLNLWSVLNQMQLSRAEQEAIAPALAAYELALDEALVARATSMGQLETELKDAMSSMDYDKGASVQDRIAALRVAVRTVNDEAVETIAEALGERGPEFRTAALRAGYADAFRKHPVMILIEQSQSIETLTPEQQEQIEALRLEFQVVMDETNMRFYEILRAEEPKTARRKVQAQKARQLARERGDAVIPNPDQNDPLAQMRTERERVGEPYRQRLMAILGTAEQESLGMDKLDRNALRPANVETGGISNTPNEQGMRIRDEQRRQMREQGLTRPTPAPGSQGRHGERGIGNAPTQSPREGRGEGRGAGGREGNSKGGRDGGRAGGDGR